MVFPDWLVEREAVEEGVLTRLMRESKVSYYPLWRASQGKRVSFASATKIRATMEQLYGDCPVGIEELCAPPPEAVEAARRRAAKRHAAVPKAS